MTRMFLAALVALSLTSLAACTRNPEGSEGRRATPRNHDQPVAEAPQPRPLAPDQLPEGHPPLGQGGAQGGTAPVGGPPPGAGAPEPDAEGRLTVAGIQWQAAAPLVYQAPSSAMRAAQYGIDGGDEGTELTVFHFPGGGGGIQANIDRWVGQMRVSADRPPETTRSMVAGMQVTKIDVYGGFGGMQMPGQAGAEGADGGYRMLGAIVEGPAGPVFFKMVGPEATVNLAAEAFDGLIASFRPAS